MFAYISGRLEDKENNAVIVDNGGIGYRIFMPQKGIQSLPELGEVVKIYTYHYVREDNISLYGFITKEELRMFELLLSVSGIGAKSAVVVISEMSPSNFALDVISGDVTNLVKVPGIGKKTAQRVILELKDKLKTESAILKQEEVEDCNLVQEINSNKEEAIAALLVLGYTKKDVENAMLKIELKDLSTEDIIRKALAILAR